MGENDIAKENNSSFEQTLCFWHWPLCGASHTTHTHSFIQQRKSQGQKLQNKTKIIIFLFILYIQQKTANTQKKRTRKIERKERERGREKCSRCWFTFPMRSGNDMREVGALRVNRPNTASAQQWHTHTHAHTIASAYVHIHNTTTD